MMQYTVLFFVTLTYMFGCWLTYAERLREKWWYIPLGVGVSMVAGLLWFYAAKLIEDKQKLFVFTVIWDAIVMMIYYGMPILLFGARPDKWTVMGLILIVAGAIMIKTKA